MKLFLLSASVFLSALSHFYFLISLHKMMFAKSAKYSLTVDSNFDVRCRYSVE